MSSENKQKIWDINGRLRMMLTLKMQSVLLTRCKRNSHCNICIFILQGSIQMRMEK